MKTNLRSQKVATLLQQHMPIVLQRFISPDHVGIVTVTGVEVSGDLLYADVYVRSVGGKKDFVQRLDGLSKKISYALSHIVNLRKPLIIRFKYDKTPDFFEKDF